MRARRVRRWNASQIFTTICALLIVLCSMSGVDARRRARHVSLAADDSNPNPTVSVRLCLAPPWRITVAGDARLDDVSLPAGSHDITWHGDGLQVDGAPTAHAAATSLLLTSSEPVSINGHRYRGALTFRRYSVLNRLSLDDYLRGVVGAELGVKAELEALKAQAVVARTYALGHLTAEIADDTSFQVYRGLEVENESTNRAVTETAGQVLTWQGRLAREVCYHSTCGGHTESNEFVFLTAPVAYLRSVPCSVPIPAPAATGEAPDETASVALLASAEGPAPVIAPAPSESRSPSESRAAQACERSNWAHWKICWPAAHLPEVTVLRTTPSGRVLQVRVGNRVVSGDDIRRALRFADVTGRVRPLYSTMFTLRRDGACLIAEGSGWGHGLGLCQWGARGMACAGRGYVEILTHYFPGTEVSVRVATHP